MSDSGHGRGWRGWLERRYEITPLIEFLRHKEVPSGPHSMVWYYLGGTTMFFFVVQVATGVLLLMYYQPGEATAYESIRYLTTKVPFGWLMRSVHCTLWTWRREGIMMRGERDGRRERKECHSSNI